MRKIPFTVTEVVWMINGLTKYSLRDAPIREIVRFLAGRLKKKTTYSKGERKDR